MSKQNDYLPRQESSLVDWGGNFVAEITANSAQWEIPPNEITGVTTALAVFKTLHTQAAGPERNRVKIRARDETTPDSRAIPYGYNGCPLRYAWESESVTNRALLTKSILMTRFPFTLTLPPEAPGSRLSCTACWQNRDLVGQPGAIENVVIA